MTSRQVIRRLLDEGWYEIRHTVLAPSGSLVTFRLNSDKDLSGTQELALLILTRLPRR